MCAAPSPSPDSPQKLSAEQRRQLLAHARRAVQLSCAALDPESPEGSAAEAFAGPDFASFGAFVTLHKQGNLRGCIGTFAQSQSVLKTLDEMALAASQRDPRFSPVQAHELSLIDVEISLLTPLRPVADVAEIEVGRHGLCMSRGWQRGVLLPQVATEQGWDRETFLQQTCRKAGLPLDAWQDPDTRIQSFEAVVFGEKDSR